MSNDNNMAPGKQNFPSKEEPQGNPHRRSTEEIVEGARTEDQLDEFKNNAPKAAPNIMKVRHKVHLIRMKNEMVSTFSIDRYRTDAWSVISTLCHQKYHHTCVPAEALSIVLSLQ